MSPVWPQDPWAHWKFVSYNEQRKAVLGNHSLTLAAFLLPPSEGKLCQTFLLQLGCPYLGQLSCKLWDMKKGTGAGLHSPALGKMGRSSLRAVISASSLPWELTGSTSLF